jgi:hypothetical protein
MPIATKARKKTKTRRAVRAVGKAVAKKATDIATSQAGKFISGATGELFVADAIKVASYSLKQGRKVWKNKQQKKAMINILSRAIGNSEYARKARKSMSFRNLTERLVAVGPFEYPGIWMERMENINLMLETASRARVKKGLTAKETIKQRRKIAAEIYQEMLDRLHYQKKAKTKHMTKLERAKERLESRKEKFWDWYYYKGGNKVITQAEFDKTLEKFRIMQKPFLSRKEKRKRAAAA